MTEALCVTVVDRLRGLVVVVNGHAKFFGKPNPGTVLAAVASNANKASTEIRQLSKAAKDPSLKKLFADISDKIKAFADTIPQGLFTNVVEALTQIRFIIQDLEKTITAPEYIAEYKTCIQSVGDLAGQLR